MNRLGNASVMAALAAALMIGISHGAFLSSHGLVSTAHAAGEHEGGGCGGGSGGSGGSGGGGGGSGCGGGDHESGDSHDSDHADGGDHGGGKKGKGKSGGGHAGGQGGGGHAAGQGGRGGSGSSHAEDDSGRRGPRAGRPTQDSRGGRPAWAGGGIPEVELGRLNVVRAPANILDRARQEVIANTAAADITAYASVEAFLAEIADWENAQIFDSPLQNLAVFRDAIRGVTTLPGVPVSTDLMAITLGTASDKNMPISENTVTAVSTILGADPAGLDISTIARDAEAVRQAIKDAHG